MVVLLLVHEYVLIQFLVHEYELIQVLVHEYVLLLLYVYVFAQPLHEYDQLVRACVQLPEHVCVQIWDPVRGYVMSFQHPFYIYSLNILIHNVPNKYISSN
jgi:hypothetical protein